MKKIVLISDGWKRLVTYSWVDGITQRAKELGVDICLEQFNTNGNWSFDKKHNRGEYNLYELPDFDKYDGVVFDCTNTTDGEQIKYMVKKLQKLEIPVVSISYAVDGFYYVGNDNKKLFRAVIDHLYEKHNCREFVFAGGPDYNYENQMRFEAFREAMEDYGIELKSENYMFGDFDFGTGVRYMDEWLAQKRPFPQAFVCANDNIAAGLCSRAIAAGYKIPGDFMVTGFDNLDKAAYYNPQITTVEHNRGNIAKEAFQILYDLWNGKEREQFHYLTSEVIPGESCGCPNSGRVQYRNYIKWQIEYSVKLDENDEAVMVLENQIAECNDYESLYIGFSDYLQSLKCEGMYIVVDKQLVEADINGDFPTSGYNLENMKVVFGVENYKRLPEFESVKALYDYMDKTCNNSAYMFSSIHFRDRIVGFTILKNPTFLYDNSAFYNVLAVFVTKLENLYKQMKLEVVNNEMKNVYNRDALTGLYNRVAYKEMIVPRFEAYNKNNIKCAMIFLDVDSFKEINDTYGHKYGDEVLCRIANALEESKPSDGFAYRFGGDEFVVFFANADDEKIETFKKKILRTLRKQKTEVSLGVIVTDPGSNKTLEDYVTMADKKMYEVKSGRKNRKNRQFLKGMDISSLPEHLDGGESFYLVDGTKADAFDILAKNNVNSVRLRIWNQPELVPESKGYCNLEKTIEMAERIKEMGMHFMLDFHYSDFWADPGQQRKPKAWENLSFEELQNALYDYTKMVLDRLDDVGCLPDTVQIGNEIRSGMLFPDGAVPAYDRLAKLVNAGIRAVRDKSKDIEIMIHLDQGGRFYYQKEWFDAMFAAGMEKIDAIGISFYSFWHGTFMDLRDSMEHLIKRYNLPVYIVETAHPWRHCENEHVSEELMKTAGLPAGIEEQKKSLQLIMQIAQTVSGDMKTGVYYWEPLCIPGKSYGSWDENMGMLDENGKVLASFEAYRDFKKDNLPIDDIDVYMESLYVADESSLQKAGTNLIPNGDFAQGTKGWWVIKSPDDVEVREGDQEIYVSAKSNFKFDIFREIHIDKAGKYQLSVEYRGTNTTGVNVELFLKTINFDGENMYKTSIFPSDVRFVTHTLDILELKPGQVQLGIKMDTPPVFGRIKNISLIELE